MIGVTGKGIVGVLVYTVYEDGSIDFMQDAPCKTPEGFAALKEGFKNIAAMVGKTLKNQAQCPFSPDNPNVYSYTDNEPPNMGSL